MKFLPVYMGQITNNMMRVSPKETKKNFQPLLHCHPTTQAVILTLMTGSTTIRLRTFRLRHFVYRHFVYRHFVYYCIPACTTAIHPTSVSANQYFHQLQLPITL